MSDPVDLFGEPCDADDPYNVRLWDVDNPVVIRDTGGSIPRSPAEWIDTILADAESVGADVSTIRAELDDETDDGDPYEWEREIQDDVTAAINATSDYVVVEDYDSQAWLIVKRKQGVEA